MKERTIRVNLPNLGKKYKVDSDLLESIMYFLYEQDFLTWEDTDGEGRIFDIKLMVNVDEWRGIHFNRLKKEERELLKDIIKPREILSLHGYTYKEEVTSKDEAISFSYICDVFRESKNKHHIDNVTHQYLSHLVLSLIILELRDVLEEGKEDYYTVIKNNIDCEKVENLYKRWCKKLP